MSVCFWEALKSAVKYLPCRQRQEEKEGPRRSSSGRDRTGESWWGGALPPDVTVQASQWKVDASSVLQLLITTATIGLRSKFLMAATRWFTTT